MRVFDFSHAIVRPPGRSVVDGLRTGATAPSYEGVLADHRAYTAALRTLGLAVHVLPPLEAFPDSMFVEDPALVFPQGAVLLNPGAPSRNGEREEMRDTLRHRFDRVLELGQQEFVDGGDVLVTPDAVFIGLSMRTNKAGAAALCSRLSQLGRVGRVVESPPGVLHLKSAVALIDEDTVLLTPTLAAGGIFEGFRVLITAEGEEAAANALRIGDTVLAGECYPRTIESLRRAGFEVLPLPIGEVAKLDAGLSCMSLRW